jgi:hypothetical protein
MTIRLAVAIAVSDTEPERSGQGYSHCSYDLRAVSNNQYVYPLEGQERETYPPLKVSSPAFIQPEMLPRGISDKVTAPAMRKLVSNNVDIFPILRSRLELPKGFRSNGEPMQYL